jgi:signal transduction histidine kinase
LLSNALKYSPQGGKIFVGVELKLPAVRVSVRDEGVGIAPEEMNRLFQKFSRLSTKTTAGEESTGLGLAIVKHSVERLGGRVWCESDFGKGATFLVELPLHNESDVKRE